MGIVFTASPSAQRMRLTRQAVRRREAAHLLRITEATCRYAASQIEVGNGRSPVEARAAALEAAHELVSVAEMLRRAVRLSRPERRALAAQLVNAGYLSRRQVADRLGVSERTVWRYLGHL
jgi:hypothetical protein